MKERPILFSAPMVRAILGGTKTQTRRIVKDKHLPWLENSVLNFLDGKWNQRPLPYGKPGDRLWVRETWGFEKRTEGDDRLEPVVTYRADELEHLYPVNRWRPSIHMPRHLSRITLEITGVRVERLQDISEADAKAEGVECDSDGWRDYLLPDASCCFRAVDSYRTLWESINGTDSWQANPWVWVVDFKRLEGGAA